MQISVVGLGTFMHQKYTLFSCVSCSVVTSLVFKQWQFSHRKSPDVGKTKHKHKPVFTPVFDIFTANTKLYTVYDKY